ncbi:MAG: S8 family serine peptidase [Phycisphaerales bacterium]
MRTKLIQRIMGVRGAVATVLACCGMVVLGGAGPENTPANGFEEVAGDHEFSGRMIVRPVQLDGWRAQGVEELEARGRMDAARVLAESYTVVNFVPQTGEYLITVPAGETENSVHRVLMNSGLFEYAEPDWILYPIGCPNDPLLGNQWHHNANRMQSCDGWGIHTGNPSVSVGICDTGVRTTHQDLQANRLEGYNAVDQVWEFSGGNIGPVHPHGTQTTGCAAANGDNGVGVSGVGWNLSHRMMRVSNSSSGSASMSTLQHAARTSIEAGDRVASVSYSGVDNSSNLTTASYIKSIGGLLVWAAGNDGRNLTFGNRDNDDIIVVGATDSNDNSSYFSAYGQFVDLTAPGSGVYTTDSGNDSDYASVSGTSFACPLAAGLAALIWSQDPSLTPDDVENRLKSGCDDLGSGGVDNIFGYGRINVYGSLSLGGPGNQPPVADLSATPLSGDAPLDVSFNASGSFDPDGSITDFSWDYDGDGTYDESTGTTATSFVTYTIPGSYDAVVRVTDDGGAQDTATVTIDVSDPGGGGGEQSLAFDGFESRSFSGGSGAWIGSWFGSGDIRIRWNRDNPHTGSGHVRMRRSSGYMERAVNLAGATSVKLTFWSRVESFEGSDDAHVWVSSDASNYYIVKTFTSADSDGVYRYHEIDLSGFAMTSDFRVVFDPSMSSSGDRWFVDDIDIIGVP